MVKDDTNSKGSGLEPTRIDLGDDLLEKTANIPGRLPEEQSSGGGSFSPADAPPPITPQTVADEIQSARILLNEGFPDEAKKILRRILLADESHVESRQLLEEIHELELKQMFGTAEPPVRRSMRNQYDDSILHVDSDEVVRVLDKELGLGLESAARELSFFSDKRLLNRFADKVDREIGESVRDRIDLSIGFMEMGLYELAIRLLQILLVHDDTDERLSATALVAYAHLQSHEPYRTIAAIQGVLNDNEIPREKKTEFFYLIGRAQQTIGKFSEAVSWYFQAQENEPGYRDTSDRITRCKVLQTPQTRR